MSVMSTPSIMMSDRVCTDQYSLRRFLNVLVTRLQNQRPQCTARLSRIPPLRRMKRISGSFHYKPVCLRSSSSEGKVVEEGWSKRDLSGKKGNWVDGKRGILWEAEELAQAVGGTLVKRGTPGSISTDSRTIQPGEWFLVLVGPNFDGHDFLNQALDRGCAGVIGRDVTTDWPKGFVKVENKDTLIALHRLAAYVRQNYHGVVVGITGSTGKTTARAMTALALASLGIVHQSDGNENNHIGLPNTLLRLPSTAKACVLEMGMNHSGEILALANICQPSVRVVLNVGTVHLENFGSLEEVATAKGELLIGARSGDVCVLNADDPLVMSLPIPLGTRVVLFGTCPECHVKIVDAQMIKGARAVRVVLEQTEQSDFWVEKLFTTGSQILETFRGQFHHLKLHEDSELIFDTDQIRGAACDNACTHTAWDRKLANQNDGGVTSMSRVEFEIPSPGLHLAINACAAAAVAISLGVPLQTAGKNLSNYSPIGLRSKWEEIEGGIQLINDAYNSNPISIVSSLNLLASVECKGRRIALLGDMLELGSATKKAHIDALALCQELGLALVGLVGPHFSDAARSLGLHDQKETFLMHENSAELAFKISALLRPGDTVLIKGSRAMQMEIIAKSIRTRGHHLL